MDDRTATADARPTPTDPPEDVDLPLDVAFDLLSNERRRRVIQFLLDESAETTLGELAEHVAALENDKPIRALSSTERKRVYICLYQCHLPKLDDADVVDFDEHRKSVEAGVNVDAVARYLPRTGDDDGDERTGINPMALVAPVLGGLFLAQQQLAPEPLLSGLLVGLAAGSVVATAVGWSP